MRSHTRYFAAVAFALAAAVAAGAIADAQGRPRAPASAKTATIDPILELGSPDGKWAIYRQDYAPRRVMLRNLASGQDRELIVFPRTVNQFVWSLDSRQIAFSTDSQAGERSVHIVSIATGDHRVLDFVGGQVFGWTAKGEVLVRSFQPPSPGAPGRNSYALVPSEGGTTRTIHTESGAVNVSTILPGGETLLLRGPGRIALREITAGIERDVVRMPGSARLFPVLSPSGRRVAFESGGALYVAPLDQGFVSSPLKVTDLNKKLGSDFPTMWWTGDDTLAVPSLTSWTQSIYRIDMDASGHARGRARLLLTHADWPVVSPDSRQIAHTFYEERGLGIIGATGGPDRLVLKDPIAAQVYGWRSPSVVVLAGAKQLSTLDVRTGSRAAVYQGPEAGSVDDYSPARDEALFVERTGDVTTLKARSLRNGAVRDVAAVSGITEFRFSADGSSIAYTRRTGSGPESGFELRVISADGQRDVPLITGARALDPIAWSPTGKYLAYLDGAMGNQLRILEVETRKSWPVLPDTEQLDWVDQASWAPDGSFLAIGAAGDVHEPFGRVFNISDREASVPPQSASSAEPPSSRTRVIVLGTGNPVADPNRFGPAVAIVVDDETYLIDAGVGVVRRAQAAGIQATRLARVFLTHLHSDHTLGLPDLMLSAWVLGRPGPLDVYGPPGTADMARHIEEAYREDIGMRTYGLEPKHAARGYRAVTHEVRAGRVYEDAKVKVDAIPVLHGTWPEAFGYRIQTVDRTIVVSGDTRPAPAIAEACNGCDVLIHEVYSTARVRSGEWQAYDRAYHTSTSELAAIATQAKPRLLVLYHQMPRGFVDSELEQEIAKAGYTGRTISARDLDVY